MSAFDQIPENAHPFYVSDTFSIQLPVPVVLHYPGPFNTLKTYGPSTEILIYLLSADLAVTPLNIYTATNPNSGINTDVRIGLYDVTQGAAWAGVTAYYCGKYGSAIGNPIQQSSTFNRAPVAARDWRNAPLTLKLTTPDTPGKTYQLGASFQFNNGLSGCHAHYQYSIHGASA